MAGRGISVSQNIRTREFEVTEEFDDLGPTYTETEYFIKPDRLSLSVEQGLGSLSVSDSDPNGGGSFGFTELDIDQALIAFQALQSAVAEVQSAEQERHLAYLESNPASIFGLYL